MSYHEGSKWQEQQEAKKKDKEFEKDVRDAMRGSHNRPGARDAKWIRYRFKTKAVDDYRPLIFSAKYPWWCSGEAADGSHAVIIAYLPLIERLEKYWDDAFDIEKTEHATIAFTERFPKPNWFTE
jgi:hypothetical protein